MMYGIDVSANQGQIDWNAVAATHKVEFVYARAIHISDSEPSGEDHEFVRNHDECTRLGIPFGAYLFYVPQEDAASQADRFLTLIRGRVGELVPMIDVENGPKQQWANSFDERVANLRTCIDRVESALGRPIIYTNPYTWRERFDNASVATQSVPPVAG